MLFFPPFCSSVLEPNLGEKFELSHFNYTFQLDLLVNYIFILTFVSFLREKSQNFACPHQQKFEGQVRNTAGTIYSPRCHFKMKPRLEIARKDSMNYCHPHIAMENNLSSNNGFLNDESIGGKAAPKYSRIIGTRFLKAKALQVSWKGSFIFEAISSAGFQCKVQLFNTFIAY